MHNFSIAFLTTIACCVAAFKNGDKHLKNYYATTAFGLEGVLAKEVRSLTDATDVKVARGGVFFKGTEKTAFEGLLWFRSCLRLMERLGDEGQGILRKDDLYEFCRSFDWTDILDSRSTIKCDTVIGQATGDLCHSHFSSLTVKNAITDHFDDLNCGTTPTVAIKDPDVCIHLYLHRGSATVFKDLSGEYSLHKRGYRDVVHKAALRETTAASLVLLSQWQHSSANGMLCDPMCGSATIAIEAALLAANTAPGLIRYHPKSSPQLSSGSRHGTGLPSYLRWSSSTTKAKWYDAFDEALRVDKREEMARSGIKIAVANDVHPGAIELAVRGAVAAGVHEMIHFSHRDAGELVLEDKKIGTIISNPPWDLRLGDATEAWKSLGGFARRTLSRDCGTMWVLSGNPNVLKELHMKPTSSIPITGPTTEMRFLKYDYDIMTTQS